MSAETTVPVSGHTPHAIFKDPKLPMEWVSSNRFKFEV